VLGSRTFSFEKVDLNLKMIEKMNPFLEDRVKKKESLHLRNLIRLILDRHG
jgi:hypothetical protein